MEDTPTPDPLTKLYLMTIVWECADSARRGSAVSGTLLKFQVQPLSFREALREIYWKCLILALGTIHNKYVLFSSFFFFFLLRLWFTKRKKKNIFKLLRALPSFIPPSLLPSFPPFFLLSLLCGWLWTAMLQECGYMDDQNGNGPCTHGAKEKQNIPLWNLRIGLPIALN